MNNKKGRGLSGESLLTLARALGIEVNLLRGAEKPGKLSGTFRVTGKNIAQLRWRDFLSCQDSYGSHLEIEIRLGVLRQLSLGSESTKDEFEQFKDQLDVGSEFEVVLSLNKAGVLSSMLETWSGWQFYWFIFSERFGDILMQGLEHIERELWSEERSQLIILIDNACVSARGDFLNILDSSEVNRAKEIVEGPAPDWELVDHMRKARDNFISWDHPWAKILTPLHFDVDFQRKAKCNLADLISAQVLKLAVLYTCDRARLVGTEGQKGIRAEYRGQHYSTVVWMAEEQGLELTPDRLKSIQKLVLWCYRRESGGLERDWVQNRLPFVQARVAEALTGVEVVRRLEVLADYIPHLLEGLEVQWKAFIEDRVAEYLGKLRQLDQLVNTTVAAYAQHTADLTKGLVETLLAAVGVLVGSFVAAALGSPFNETLFRISVVVYLCYVVAGPLLVGLGSKWTLLVGQREEYQAQRGHFQALMNEERISGLVGDRIKRAEHRFWFWFGVALLGYVLLAVGLICGAVVVPDAVTI